MDYEFVIYGKSADKRWITIISNDERDCDIPDAFVTFVEKVNEDRDEPGMTYTWDPTFCISVTYPEGITEEQAVMFLSRYAVG